MAGDSKAGLEPSSVEGLICERRPQSSVEKEVDSQTSHYSKLTSKVKFFSSCNPLLAP